MISPKQHLFHPNFLVAGAPFHSYALRCNIAIYPGVHVNREQRCQIPVFKHQSHSPGGKQVLCTHSFPSFSLCTNVLLSCLIFLHTTHNHLKVSLFIVCLHQHHLEQILHELGVLVFPIALSIYTFVYVSNQLKLIELQLHG